MYWLKKPKNYLVVLQFWSHIEPRWAELMVLQAVPPWVSSNTQLLSSSSFWRPFPESLSVEPPEPFHLLLHCWGPCASVSATWIIQDTLCDLRSTEQIYPAFCLNASLSCNVACSWSEDSGRHADFTCFAAVLFFICVGQMPFLLPYLCKVFMIAPLKISITLLWNNAAFPGLTYFGRAAGEGLGHPQDSVDIVRGSGEGLWTWVGKF